MMKIVKDGFQTANDSRFSVREKTAGIVNVITTFKDVIDIAVKSSPEASLAWAGVSFCLPLLTNSHTENEAFKEAFGYITSRAPVYALMEEEVFVTAATNFTPSGLEDTRLAFLDVYTAVIRFQAEAAKRLYGKKAVNFIKDVLQWQGWADLSAEVQATEEKLKGIIMLNNSNSSANVLGEIARNISSNSEKFCHLFQVALRGMGEVIVPLLEDQRDTAHDQLATEQRQLEMMEGDSHIQKQILANQQHQSSILKEREAREFSEKEKKVREAFRIDTGQPDYKFWKDNTKDRADDTCEWFLKHSSYHSWLDKETGVLLVTANPGCGKSVLAKYLIDKELPSRQTTSSMVCYFFFKEKIQETLRQALCALIYQLLFQDRNLIAHAMDYFTDGEEGKKSITSVNVMLEILEQIIRDKNRKTITLVVDALDECVQTNNGDDVQRWIRFVLWSFADSSPAHHLKMIMTSRPYDSITSKFGNFGLNQNIRISGEELMDGLRKEIDKVISLEVRQLGLAKDLEAYLETKLHNFGNRTYLWVSLIFDNVDFKRTKMGIEEWLQDLPQSVEDYYAKMLQNAKDTDFMQAVFCLILVAKSPIRVRELNEAINSRSGQRTLDLESVEDFKVRLHRECGLFVIVHRGIVDFIHLTAREYLLAKPNSLPESNSIKDPRDPGTPQPKILPHSISVPQAHRIVAECCLTFLTMPTVLRSITHLRNSWSKTAEREAWNMDYFDENSSLQSSEDESEEEDIPAHRTTSKLQDVHEKITDRYTGIHKYIPDFYILENLQHIYTFHKYAGEHWYYHVMQSRDEALQFDPRAQRLCDSTTLLPCAWRGFLFPFNDLSSGRFAFPQQNTALWYFSAIGFSHATRAAAQSLSGHLLDKVVSDKYQTAGFTKDKHDMIMDYMTTPLWQAVNRNHGQIADELLRKGASPNSQRPVDLTTPLHMACFRGSSSLVYSLLKANAKVNIKDIEGNTAVHVAAKLPRPVACLQLLVEHGASLDVRNNSQATPLHDAASAISVQAIRFLLQHGADVFAQNKGESTLLHAFQIEFDGTPTKAVKSVFKVLLEERKPSGERLINICDDYGKSPLLLACRLQHTELALMLIEKGANIYLEDIYQRQPLHYACFLEDTTLVKALIEKHNDVNIEDEEGMTPLAYAVVSGNAETVTELLKKGATLNSGDFEGNHLQCAAFLNENAVEILRILDQEIKEEQIDKFKEMAKEEEDFWKFIKETECCN
jgi:ankyrin repeat protein